MPAFMDHQESEEVANFIEVTNDSLNIPMKKLLVKKESLGSEKQISVDPISLKAEKESSNIRLTIPAYPTKKLLSISLPNSTTSSPELFGTKKKNYCQSKISPLARQHSVALTNIQSLKEIHLLRSKSCGEGRASAPPEEFDIWFANNTSSSVKGTHNAGDDNKFSSNDNSFFPEESEGDRMNHGTCNADNSSSSGHNQEEKFKCGALCLFIPGRFGKGKPVRFRRQESGLSSSSVMGHHHHVVSRTVSLEKFECGSWTSSAIINEEAGAGASNNNLFFDLPMELIRCSANDDDTHSPVTAAFVFDKEVKGVLKNTSTAPNRKSHESTRHVRFSTSSPTSYPASPTSACVTPRLRRAREDFTTFLEAQSAS